MNRVVEFVSGLFAGKKSDKQAPAPGKQSSPEEIYDRFEQVMALEAGGISVGVKEAYARSAWVYGAVSIIAEAVSRTPFIVAQGENEIRSGPAYSLVNKPNDYDNQDTSTKFRAAYMIEILLNGAVIKVFSEIDGQTPRKMVVLPRSHFRAETAIDDLGREVVRRWHMERRGTRRTYIPNDEIYHDALYNPMHDWEGLAPLSAAISVVSNDIQIGEFTKRFFQNGALAGLVFTSDDPAFDLETAKKATELWNAAHRGTRNAWKTAFLGNNLKPHQIGTGIDARTLGALKSLTKEEIVTGIFKVPLSIFGQSDAAGNQGVVIGGQNAASDSEKEGFLINVIMPWARRYDEEFNKDIAWRFGPGVSGYHDFSENPILENRRLARAQAAAELLQHGLTINGVIRWLRLELEEVPWGDEWLVKDDMVPASLILKAGDSLIPDKSKKSGSQSAGMPKIDADPRQEAIRKQIIEEYAAGIAAEAEKRLISGLHEAESKKNGQSHDGNGNGRPKFVDRIREVIAR